MDGQRLFRQEAIDAVNRIETLPQAMRVTTSWTNRTLAALAVALIGVALWSAFAKVPIHVEGRGILLDPSGKLTEAVLAPASGRIDALLVTAGMRVKKGQSVARIRYVDQDVDLEQSERELAEAKAQAEQGEKLREQARRSELASIESQKTAINTKLENLQHQLEWQNQRIEDVRKLVEDGLYTRVQLTNAEIAAQTAADDLASARAEMFALDAQFAASEMQRGNEALAQQHAVEQAEDQIAAEKKVRVFEETMTSPIDGEVVAVTANEGTLVTPGQKLVELLVDASEDSPVLEAILFVDLEDGKRVAAGDTVLLAPSSLPSGVNDRVLAEVVSVSETPISGSAVLDILGNDQLAATVQQDGSPFAIHVRLIRNARTPSGYAWISGKGPEIRLTLGTPLSGRITVERVTVLSLAIPALRLLLGDRQETWSESRL